MVKRLLYSVSAGLLALGVTLGPAGFVLAESDTAHLVHVQQVEPDAVSEGPGETPELGPVLQPEPDKRIGEAVFVDPRALGTTPLDLPSRGNRTSAYQIGSGNKLSVEVAGVLNRTMHEQVGDGNVIDAQIKGARNRVYQGQFGAENVSNITLEGDNADVRHEQHGDRLGLRLSVTGTGQRVGVVQSN